MMQDLIPVCTPSFALLFVLRNYFSSLCFHFFSVCLCVWIWSLVRDQGHDIKSKYSLIQEPLPFLVSPWAVPGIWEVEHFSSSTSGFIPEDRFRWVAPTKYLGQLVQLPLYVPVFLTLWQGGPSSRKDHPKPLFRKQRCVSSSVHSECSAASPCVLPFWHQPSSRGYLIHLWISSCPAAVSVQCVY